MEKCYVYSNQKYEMKHAFASRHEGPYGGRDNLVLVGEM